MNYRRVFLENGMVFLTLVTYKRIPILINNIDILKKSLSNLLKIYKFRLVAFVVLPDHIHCIIQPRNILEYPKIVKAFKYSFSKNVGLVKPTYKRIWQNRYWEHTIRDEKDLYMHLNYIHFNPVKHCYSANVKDWVYSSFHKFVSKNYYGIDWGSLGDVMELSDLCFE